MKNISKIIGTFIQIRHDKIEINNTKIKYTMTLKWGGVSIPTFMSIVHIRLYTPEGDTIVIITPGVFVSLVVVFVVLLACLFVVCNLTNTV